MVRGPLVDVTELLVEIPGSFIPLNNPVGGLVCGFEFIDNKTSHEWGYFLGAQVLE